MGPIFPNFQKENLKIVFAKSKKRLMANFKKSLEPIWRKNVMNGQTNRLINGWTDGTMG
jgi:hypothetical protein